MTSKETTPAERRDFKSQSGAPRREFKNTKRSAHRRECNNQALGLPGVISERTCHVFANTWIELEDLVKHFPLKAWRGQRSHEPFLALASSLSTCARTHEVDSSRVHLAWNP